MSFKMKYTIGKDYLKVGTARRSGKKISKVKFIVLHDVGNDGVDKNKDGKKEGTTARNNISYYRNNPTISASAHTFIDNNEILECIPAVTAAPEKAWHVIYSKTKDNQLYGADSNDAAIGVELCYYPDNKAKSLEAYNRYVWYCAYLAFYFKLDPEKCYVGHEILDPGRKFDPSNGIKHSGKNYSQLLADIKAEYKACTATASANANPATVVTTNPTPQATTGLGMILVDSLNIRATDSSSGKIAGTYKKGDIVKITAVGSWGYKTAKGWIAKGTSYVAFHPGAIGLVTILADSLNVRKADNVSSAIVGQVTKWNSFYVYGIGTWGYNVGTGFVSKNKIYTEYKAY